VRIVVKYDEPMPSTTKTSRSTESAFVTTLSRSNSVCDSRFALSLRMELVKPSFVALIRVGGVGIVVPVTSSPPSVMVAPPVSMVSPPEVIVSPAPSTVRPPAMTVAPPACTRRPPCFTSSSPSPRNDVTSVAGVSDIPLVAFNR